MLRFILALGLLVSSMPAFSKDCVVVPSVSLCGVSLKASQSEFERSFGEPDGRISMGKDRVGLFYGTNFIVIFWHGKIWEVQNWVRKNIVDATDWFGYVGFGRNDRETRAKFQDWNPWNEPMPSKAVNMAMPILDSDGASDIREIRGGSIFLLFDQQELDCGIDRSKVTYIKVNFGGEPVGQP